MTAFNLIKSLTKRGNVIIGAGCYAAAISSSNKTDQIIKIGNSVKDPWITYYKDIITLNQANPHVPKVTHFMCDEQHNYYICIMEKLEESYEYAAHRRKLANLCKDYVTLMITRVEFVEAATKYKKAIPCADDMANLLDKIREGTETFVSEEGSTARKLDMHAGNFLFRDEVLVVTDPWSQADMSEIKDVSTWVDKNTMHTNNYFFLLD